MRSRHRPELQPFFQLLDPVRPEPLVEENTTDKVSLTGQQNGLQLAAGITPDAIITTTGPLFERDGQALTDWVASRHTHSASVIGGPSVLSSQPDKTRLGRAHLPTGRMVSCVQSPPEWYSLCELKSASSRNESDEWLAKQWPYLGLVQRCRYRRIRIVGRALG